MTKEKSKNIFEDSKEGTIGARIKTLIAETGISVSGLEVLGNVGNATLKSWKDKDLDYSTTIVENFLNTAKINREWWKTGKGEMFITSVQESSDNKEKSKSTEEIYKDLVESNSEYRLIPKTILNGEYRIMLKSELEEKAQMWRETLQAKNFAITQLEKEVAELRSGRRVAVHAKKA